MPVVGVVRVRCPACDREHEAKLVQSINARSEPEAAQRLLAGELNVLDCDCGHRTQLTATLLYHDPDADFWCQVCPGGETAMSEGEAAFRAAGAGGTRRLVPSTNALIEKIKLVNAGLADWAIEMIKVLLLASREDRNLDLVLLFDSASDDAIHWVLFDPAGPRAMASPRSAYAKLAERASGRPTGNELRIDRAWAFEAVRTMIAGAN